MENEEKIWSTSLVMKEAEGTVVFSSSYIAKTFEEAIGIALCVFKERLEKGVMSLVCFDADYQDETDLFELMKRKGWKPTK